MIALKNILVATDFGEPSEAALLYGKNFARAHGATLHVLHVADDVVSRISPMGGPLPDVGHMQLELEDDARSKLNDQVTEEDRRVLHAQTILRTSTAPAQAILAYAGEAAIDLIIVGTHGRTGITHFFLGSVAQHVVRLAPCPVLTVRRPEREFIRPDALQRAVSQPHA